MISHLMTTYSRQSAERAVISAARTGISEFRDNAQAIHIIVASIIYRQNRWKAVVRVIVEEQAEEDSGTPITFCHLPGQYDDLYETMLIEVDHVNLIKDEDTSTLEKIEDHLFERSFYEAVHFIQSEYTREEEEIYWRRKMNNDLESPRTKALLSELKVNQ